jgi:hypothetical protein
VIRRHSAFSRPIGQWRFIPVVDEQAQIREAQKATEKVVAELWERLSKEVPAEDSYKFFVFARKVLDWCEDHRRCD